MPNGAPATRTPCERGCNEVASNRSGEAQLAHIVSIMRDAPEPPRSVAQLGRAPRGKPVDAGEPVAPNDPADVRHLAPLEHEVDVAVDGDGIRIDVPARALC